MKLPAETVAAIGTVTEHVYEVGRKDIRRYAQAIGDDDPRYRAGDLAPPLFCHSLAFEDVPVEELRADGLPSELDGASQMLPEPVAHPRRRYRRSRELRGCCSRQSS